MSVHSLATCSKDMYKSLTSIKTNLLPGKPLEVMGSNCTGVRGFFSFSVWTHFLSRAFTHQKVLFGIFKEHFNKPHLNHYLTISHWRQHEYQWIVTETKSRWLSRYSQSLRWLIVLVKLHWWLFEKIKQNFFKLLNLQLQNINKSGCHFENWKPSLLWSPNGDYSKRERSSQPINTHHFR